MKTADLLDTLLNAGIKLWVEGDRIRLFLRIREN